MEFLTSYFDQYQEFITEYYWLALLMTMILPFIEAIIPTLPLGAMIGINLSALSQAFGGTVGTLLTIFLSVLGSFLGMLILFIIIRKTLSNKFRHKIEDHEVGKKFLNIANESNLGLMFVFLANPFLPSSILNYALSFTSIKLKNYIGLTIASRFVIILFFVFLGSLFDVQSHPLNVLWLSLFYVLLFFILLIVKKKHH